MVRRYTFGGLRIARDGRPMHLQTVKTGELLCYLITYRARQHPRISVQLQLRRPTVTRHSSIRAICGSVDQRHIRRLRTVVMHPDVGVLEERQGQRRL